MIISEIFYSLQGEGMLAGVPSIFVRLAGCPLRCKWCDTKYAWDPSAGTDYTIDRIIRTVKQWPCSFVVITGGEPMVNPDLPQLSNQLKKMNKHVTIETSGIIFSPDLSCDLMSISPKLSNSLPDEPDLAAIHEKSRLNINALQKLIDTYNYQLKFIIDSENDLADIKDLIKKISIVDSAKVMLMPQAATREQLLSKSLLVAELCKQTGFAFSQRLHILLWNNKMGV